MNTVLQMRFDVDKVNNKIRVTREFNSSLDNVWAAWTQPALLDQWWAPRPYRAETKRMSFSTGGIWLYAMIGPEGDEIFCKAEYLTIDSQRSFSWKDSFCDENGEAAEEFPGAIWNTVFQDQGNHTTIDIEIIYKSLSHMEKIIEMGFKEGFTAALENLDALFAAKQ